MKCFSQWPDYIHSTPDQVKRRINGETIKAKDITVDRASKSMKVNGSADTPYETTLEECSCVDFALKGNPCKHMYRLASELGLIDPWPSGTPGGIRAAAKLAEDDILKWEKEFKAGNISPKKYSKIVDALRSK